MDVELKENNNLCIPADIRIGVTGHRKLANEQLLRESVKGVLGKLDKMLCHTPHKFVAVSPLAEGADRLVAKEIIEWKASENKSILEAVLPLPEEEYENDFETQKSRNEFRELLVISKIIPPPKKTESRDVAYKQAGFYVVDNCDVLITIWNGKPAAGKGGTAEILEYASKAGRSIFWINSENSSIKENRNEDHSLESLEYLDAYNKEKFSSLEKDSENQFNKLAEQAIEAGITPDILEPLKEDLLPQFVRADFLAQRYQNRHMKAGSAVYALAAAAVATITIQTLIFPQLSELLWLEVVEIAVILMLLLASHIGGWQRKWIDYRFLAEHLRADLFLCAAGIKCEQSPSPPYLSDDWVIRAYAWIWNKRPQAQSQNNIPALKKFLLTAWMEDQISFYTKKSKQHKRKHVLLARGGEALFLITLVAAFIHAVEFKDSSQLALSSLSNTLASVTIILPAIGASLAGIRIHREYLRNAERYAPMVRYLSMIRDQIKLVSDIDMENLTKLLEKANDMMLRENQDWRVVFNIPKLEAP